MHKQTLISAFGFVLVSLSALVSVFVCASLLSVPPELAPPAQAGEPPCQDTVRAEAVGNSINVYHDQAEWNCCATIQFELVQRQDTLNVYESETFEVGPCHCICCFDLLTTIVDATPGEYLVRVLAAESGELFGEVWVTVGGLTSESAVDVVSAGGKAGAPGVLPSQPEVGRIVQGQPGIGGFLQSPCGGWTASVGEKPASWGQIKAVYR